MLELAGDGWSRCLESGDRVRFGRGGSVDDDDVELVVHDDPRLHRHCGTIDVDDDGWSVANTGRWLRVRVVSLDRAGFDDLRPGDRLRVPWRSARVEIHVGERCHAFTARFTSEAEACGPPSDGALSGDGDGDVGTAAPVRLDRAAGYFRALVALCEPQLRDPSSTEVATDLQIALRLNGLSIETRRVSGKAIERRLDQCRVRFGLKEYDHAGFAAGLERRDARRRLVEAAILSGTVSADDLQVLAAVVA
ncbi:MAG: hypothetical protein U0Q22_04085 [Acidimicrobiales bacterium]